MALDTDAVVPFDLSDELTACAQYGFGAARRKGLLFLFDYVGCLPNACGPASRVHMMARLMLTSFVNAMSAGKLFFRADVQRVADDRCKVQLRVCNTDIGPDSGVIQDADMGSDVQALPRHPSQPAYAVSVLTLAANLCRSMGGRFSVERLRGEGGLACAEFAVECVPPVTESQDAQAGGAQAWLIGDPLPVVHESLALRLQRLGWSVHLHSNAAQALEVLHNVGLDHAPALLCGLESCGVSLRDIEALRDALPPASATCWLVDIFAHRARPPRGAIGVLATPPGQSTLLDLTAGARLSPLRRPPPGAPEPAPRTKDRRPRVLVVDDNRINRLLASEMLRVLGYETEESVDGMDAVVRCLARAPHAVLMDIAMPRMDGLAATRKLRQLMRDGVLEHFPILAFSAQCDDLNRKACKRAGVDTLLPKPIDMPTLRDHLRNALADTSR